MGRGQGAAARRGRRGQLPGLAAVGVLGRWAAWRPRRWTPASRRQGRLSVDRAVLRGSARQGGGGVAAPVPARSHQSRARWAGVRSQSCGGRCAGGGAECVAVCANGDLCACVAHHALYVCRVTCYRIGARECRVYTFSIFRESRVNVFSILKYRDTFNRHDHARYCACRSSRSTSRVASDSSAGPTPRPERWRSEFTRLDYRARRAAASKTRPGEPS